MNGKLRLFRKVVRCKFIKNFYSSNSNNRLLDILADMPKSNTARIVEVQRQRQKLAKKGEKYGSSTIYLQVLGSGARGAPNTLYLFTDQKRYLFNCGECTQRLAHEHKIKLSRLDHVFITNKTWRNLGGLPGLSLTLQDVGVPNITLHGPEGLDELYNATKRFVVMKDLNVTMAKCSPAEDFEDNVMSIKYILLGPHDNILNSELKPAAKKPKLEPPKTEPVDQEFEEFIHDDTDYYRSKSDPKNSDNNKNRNLKHKTKSTFEKEVIKKKTEKALQNLNKSGSSCTVAYICTLKKRLGTLDLERCVEMGVKPGPLLGQLKSGQDVVLPDGKLVLSKDVKTPDDPGPVFIVLEVPEISYLKEDEFAAHFDDGTNPQENIPSVVVHYTPPHVFENPVYQSFMALFGPTTRHLILNSKNSCLGSEAVHRTQHKLHLLDPDIFPLLKDLSVPAVWNAHPPLPKTSSPIRLKGLEELKNKIALAQFQTIINMEGAAGAGAGAGGEGGGGGAAPDARPELLAARTLTMFHLRPKKQLDRSAEPKLHIQDYIQETMDVDGFVPSLEQFRRLVDNMRYAKSDAKEFPKVVFLGTGSCIPSKTRNTSAIVVQVDEQRSMLLDCGEGTFGQLVRFYGPKRVNVFLRSLKAIYISHLHADHHIGLIGVLQARREALDEVSNSETVAQPLYLLAPGQIVTWLSKYDQQFESIRGEFTLIPNQNLIESKLSSSPNSDVTSAVLATMGVEKIVTCFVSHCPNAFGVAVQVDPDHKLTYSGDTIPCDELVKIGQNSTLLIHEATMEDELADEARIKMHSTTSQAIEIGRHMNARYTVLTHFSQRYARLPRLNAHILNDNKRVGIAFDNMQITMSDLDLLPHMYAPLQLMFAEHCVELELKAAHRARAKDRQHSSPTLPASGGSSKTQSPSRDTALSQPKAKYRESHASKLRQVCRGLSLGGMKSNRSKSCSPEKRLPRSSLSSTPGSESAPHSPERTGAVSPRAASAPAKENKNSVDKVNLSPKPTIGSIATAVRSKSSNSSASPKPEVASDDAKKGRCSPKSNNSLSGLSSTGTETSSGYGKPLITPMNNRLTIRRDHRDSIVAECNTVQAVNPLNRSRSPIKSWKAENRQPPLPSPANRRLMSNSKLLIDMLISILGHLIFWRLHHVVTCLTHLQWQLLITIIAVSYLFWTAIKTPTCRDKVRGSPGPGPRPEPRNVPVVAVNKSLRQPSASPSLRSGSMPARQASTERGPKDTKSNTIQNRPCFNNNVYSRHRNFNSVNNPSIKEVPKSKISRETLRSTQGATKSITPSRESIKLANNQKANFTKDTKPGNNRISNFSNASCKSFKPQLEDIKSSYLLLHKKVLNRSMKYSQKDNNARDNPTTSTALCLELIEDCIRPWRPGIFPLNTSSMPHLDIQDETDVTSISRPEPIDEEKRRMLLLEAKHKFKTKLFWNDQKYNKIEGLNWISWK